MTWWITAIVLPLLPAFMGFLAAVAYVKFPSAVYSAIGQGQLFFVAVGVSSRCLGRVIETGRGGHLNAAFLFAIILMSAVLYGMATVWKHKTPDRAVVAGIIVIGGSFGLLLWAVNIALAVLGEPETVYKVPDL